MISLAWHINALDRQKRLPSLESLLKKIKPSEESKRPLEERRRDFEELKEKSRWQGRQP